MNSNIELAKSRDFGEIINDTFTFVRQNFKHLLKYFFIFCGFFMLAAAATSILTQLNMVKTANLNPNSFDNLERPSPFAVFTPIYFLNLFFLLVEYLSITVTILSFMALYKQKENRVPDTEEMWGYIKYYFLRVLGSAFVITLLLIVAAIFCLVPSIYLYPIMALVFPIMIVENTSFSFAFNQSFRLIKNNWWLTFGALIIVGIIVSVASALIVLPATLFSVGSLFLHITKGTTVSVTALIIAALLKEATHVFQILSVVTTSLCYFSLTENKDGTGLLERINKFGTIGSDSNTTPEEY